MNSANILQPHHRYMHKNKICTLGIEVLNIYHRDEDQIKMKIRFFHLKNGKYQYTGKGSDGYTEIVLLPKEKESDWELYSLEDYLTEH